MPCCCGCWQVFDNFDRDDSTDVSSRWNESTGDANGDWGISGWTLIEKYGGSREGTADAVIFCTSGEPARSAGEQSIGIDVVDAQSGDVFRIYPACTDAETLGTTTVEFRNIGGGEWTTTVGGDSVQQTATLIVEDTNHLWVCVDHKTGQLTAGVTSDDDPYLWLDNYDAGTGRYVALGHDNETYGAVFDNFVFSELRKGTKLCADCFCGCLGYTPKKSLVATFTDATDRASCLAPGGTGRTIDLEWEWNSGLQRWYGEITVPGGDHGSDTMLAFALKCAQADDDDPDWPGKNFTLDFISTNCCALNSNGCGVYQPIAEESTCEDPFSLVFGPFLLGCTDLTCNLCYNANTPAVMGMCDTGDPNFDGEYYIVITEAP
jgi:hypothetical protein